jgi:hypothetical protein
MPAHPPERIWRALLRWELQERDDGCLLQLTHTFKDRFKAACDGAGWQLCLDALASCLAGLSHPRRGTGPRLPETGANSTATTMTNRQQRAGERPAGLPAGGRWRMKAEVTAARAADQRAGSL